MFNDKIEEIQNKIMNEILQSDAMFIIISGEYDSGKSFLLKKLFDTSTHIPKIFQSGCDPKYCNTAIQELKNRIEITYREQENKIDVYIDELTNVETLEQILSDYCSAINKLIICTNQKNINHFAKKHSIFNLLELYGEELKLIRKNLNISVGTILCLDENNSKNNIKLDEERQRFQQRIEAKKQAKHSMNVVVCKQHYSVNTIFYT